MRDREGERQRGRETERKTRKGGKNTKKKARKQHSRITVKM